MVTNKPGASGSIGWAYVAGGPRDGSRLVLMNPEMMAVPLMGIGKTTINDFEPIARIADAGGPMKTIPAASQAAAKSSFSDRKP